MRPEHGGELENGQWPLKENGWLDFSVNLNPYAESFTDQEWLAAKSLLFQYPPPTSAAVDVRIASYLGLPNANHVVATRGGMEAIRCALELYPGRRVHIPVPCFSEYVFLCEQLGCDYQLHQVDPQLWKDPVAWLEVCVEPGSVVLFGNPNNPVGHAISVDDLKLRLQVLKEKDVHLIIDEAFVDLTGRRDAFSAVSLLNEFSNITIAGSMTKSWAIPGFRLGYIVVANVTLASRIREKQETWAHGSLIHYWAQTMLQSDRIEMHWARLKALPAVRNSFFDEIRSTEYLSVLDSEVNYGICEWTGKKGGLHALISSLKKAKIHVRECDTIPGVPSGSYIRIAVRTPAENEKFLSVLNQSGC